MEFIDIPVEQTTALTDVVLALVAIAAAIYLRLSGHENLWKTALWVWIFTLLAVAAGLGAIAHGFKLTDMVQSFLWYPINLSLGVLVALFAVAVIQDIWGQVRSRQVLPVMLATAAVFFIATLIWPDNFMIFISYQAVFMVFALAGYTWLWHKRELDGAGFMALGIFLTLVAAGIQAGKSFSFSFIWLFDHNGTYHLIQVVGIGLLLAGLWKTWGSRAAEQRQDVT